MGDLSLIPGSGRSPGEGHDNSLQYFCREYPHGQRSLAGYSPWSHKASDTTERLSTESLERQKERETETERKESVGNPRVLSYLSVSPTPNSLLPSYMNGACGHSFFFFFNWKYLVYNVVLVSGIQSDSFIYIYIFFFFRFFSIVGYYKILSIVPCAIQ